MRLSDLCAAAAISLILVACGQDRSNASSPDAATAPAAPLAAAAGSQAAKPAADALAPIPGGAGSELPKSVNTRDPIDGLAVDPSIPPVIVEIGVVRPPITVVIGVSNAENAKRIKSDPEKYAGAAQHNGVARQETDTLLPR